MMLMALFYLPLATFGLTWIIRFTDGPFHIFRRFRERVGIKYEPCYNDAGQEVDLIEEIPRGYFSELVGCFWCLSVNIALVLVIMLWVTAYMYNGEGMLPSSHYVTLWLAAFGGAGFMYELLMIMGTIRR